MRKDSVYWIVLTRQLLEDASAYLTEAERMLAEHNVNLVVANSMAHAGHSPDEIHRFLRSHDEGYAASSIMHWFRNGGDLPVHNFLRHAVSKAFSIDMAKVHTPHIEGTTIHDNVIHNSTISAVIAFHKHIKHSFDHLPETFTIYRGLGLHRETSGNEYIPHSIESWTTHLDSAVKFSTMSHHPNAIPHVFKATVSKSGIFLTHHASSISSIIPKNEELIGKEEVVPFGDKLRNVERIM